MDDDFFELPDESVQNRSPADNLLNSSIFGSSKKPTPKSIDSILASLPGRSEQLSSRIDSTLKRSAVTFQDSPSAAEFTAPSPRTLSQAPEDRASTAAVNDLKSSADRIAPSNRSISVNPAEPSRMQSSLMESLFPPTSSASAQAARSGAFSAGGIGGFLANGATSSRRNRLRDQSEDITNRSQAPKQLTDMIVDQRNLDSVTQTKEREIEELRRELSALRYEKTESQRIINELHRRLEDELRDHQQELNRLNEQYKKEINETQRRHEYEREELRNGAAKVEDVLRGVKNQETGFTKLNGDFSLFGDMLAGVRDKLNELGSRDDNVKSVIDFANTQIKQSVETFEVEKAKWNRQRNTLLAQTQNELTVLKQNYEREIIEGRQWIEFEREKLRLERVAFQEEQTAIIALIEHKKEELYNEKSEFLNREHDLLIRVVNEKALLEQQRHAFEQQRNDDVTRLREEAQYLEQCLIQVENARHSLDNVKRDYHAKQQQLNEIKSMMVEYERRRLRDK